MSKVLNTNAISVVGNFDNILKQLQSYRPPKYIVVDSYDLNLIRECKIQFPFITIICLLRNEEKIDQIELVRSGVDYPLVYASVTEIMDKLHYFLQIERSQQIAKNQNTILLNPERCSITYRRKTLILSNKEYDLIDYLYFNANRLVTKIQLLEAVWQYKKHVFSNTVDVHVVALRKKLISHFGYNFITTVHSKGYIFNLP